MPSNLSEQIINNLLKQCHPNHLGRDLPRKIAQFQEIEEGRQKLDGERRDVEIYCKNKLLDIKRRLDALQERCIHPGAVFQPDPSGGNDSSHRCDACGKVW